MSSDTEFAARCYTISRAIHWTTVALVSALLVSGLFGGIDPHGPGNRVFLWHSSLGIVLYLLSISRALLWWTCRPTPRATEARRPAATGIDGPLRVAFYVLLLSLPISGWFLASEEGMRSTLFVLPSLPQWFHEGDVQHTMTSTDPTIVVVLARIHAGLAAALSAVVVAHLLIAFRGRTGR